MDMRDGEEEEGRTNGDCSMETYTLRRGGKNTQKNCKKKVLMTEITMMVWSPT